MNSVKYIGPLSRMHHLDVPKKYDVLCLISGPEPQREMLEQKCLDVFTGSELKVLLVQGLVQDESRTVIKGHITKVNFLTTLELEKAINESDLIVSRSGYTTIMDLASLGKKAFFIPTPGQYEQRYLAKRLKSKGLISSCAQKDFSLQKLGEVQLYKGFEPYGNIPDLGSFFSLFEGE